MKNRTTDIKRKLITAAVEWAATTLLPNTMPSFGITLTLVGSIAYTAQAMAQNAQQPSEPHSSFDSDIPSDPDTPFGPSREDVPDILCSSGNSVSGANPNIFHMGIQVTREAVCLLRRMTTTIPEASTNSSSFLHHRPSSLNIQESEADESSPLNNGRAPVYGS